MIGSIFVRVIVNILGINLGNLFNDRARTVRINATRFMTKCHQILWIDSWVPESCANNVEAPQGEAPNKTEDSKVVCSIRCIPSNIRGYFTIFLLLINAGEIYIAKIPIKNIKFP
jgi:hypothetical protein